MTDLIQYGKAGSAALERREDLFSYSLQVEWASERRWLDTLVGLPSGARVAVDKFVGHNMLHPRPLHPEYALAIELLVANAVAEAKRRGFRVACVELGVWTYRTFVDLGRRITKVGLPEPITLEDGHTQSRVGHMWVDMDNEGVSLRPWANGDQLIRLVDDRGQYYVPVDDDFGDAVSWKTLDWAKVKRYKPVDYTAALEWDAVPLLQEGDTMPVTEPCEQCLLLFPVGTLRKDPGSSRQMCGQCRKDVKHARAQALAMGWDYDNARPLPKPPEAVAALPPCAHRWGVQLEGPTGRMKTRHVCILCGAPDPSHGAN